MLQRKLITAYCWRSGLIGFTHKTRNPKGAIKICTGRTGEIRKIVSVLARHAYDGKTLLIPGIPEAENDRQAEEAYKRFVNECKKRLEPTK